MTLIEILNKMEDQIRLGDTEAAHGYADDLLINLIKELRPDGIDGDAVDEILVAYEKIDKWYA